MASPVIMPYKNVLPTIHDTAFIAPTAVVIGDVHVGQGSSIWFNCVVRGDIKEIRIGDNTNIQDGTIVHVNLRMGSYIGSNITIGHGAFIHAATLEDNCFVGIGAMVLDGAVVEEGAMVAAGAVVPPGKRIPKGQVWAGNPAKVLREVTEKDLYRFKRTAEHYVELAADYRMERE